MTQPDKIQLNSLTYESENEVAQFNFHGWRGGKPFSANGALHVPTPGDLPESQVRAAVKQHVKKLLRDLADSL